MELVALALALAAPASADVLALPQIASAPDEVMVVVEIPAGGAIKYEIEPSSGRLIVDRFLSMPVAYPANYGSITATRSGDGDALDALVVTRAPIEPGALIRVRPIGVLRTIDGGEADDKIVAVPASGVDPTFDGIGDVADLPASERERILAFFRVYKQLPTGGEPASPGMFEGAEAAKASVRAAIDLYRSEVAERTGLSGDSR